MRLALVDTLVNELEASIQTLTGNHPIITLPDKDRLAEILNSSPIPCIGHVSYDLASEEQVFDANGYILAVSIRRIIDNNKLFSYMFPDWMYTGDRLIESFSTFDSDVMVRKLAKDKKIKQAISYSVEGVCLLASLEKWDFLNCMPDDDCASETQVLRRYFDKTPSRKPFSKAIYPILIVPGLPSDLILPKIDHIDHETYVDDVIFDWQINNSLHENHAKSREQVEKYYELKEGTVLYLGCSCSRSGSH